MVKESEIEINLIGQKQTFPRMLSLILGTVYLLILILVIVIPESTLRFSYILGLLFLPGLMEFIFRNLGKRKIFKDLFPFLRINHEKLSFNSFMSKAKTLYWDQVGKIDIKLFELIIKSKDGKLTYVDLNILNDENRKIVKEFALTIKEERGI